MKNKFSLIVGGLSALVGFIIGLIISLTPIGDGFAFFSVHAGLAGFISGYFVSLFLHDKPKNYDGGRIVLSGFISGAISHWLCWYFFSIQENIEYHILKIDAVNPPINLIEALYTIIFYCFFSILYLGWATIGTAISAGFFAKKKMGI